ncbi:hypothetical protein IC582_015826 [Cucumis melo]
MVFWSFGKYNVLIRHSTFFFIFFFSLKFPSRCFLLLIMEGLLLLFFFFFCIFSWILYLFIFGIILDGFLK